VVKSLGSYPGVSGSIPDPASTFPAPMSLIQDRRLDPPPTKGMRIILDEGRIRAIDPNGKVYRLRPEPGTPNHYVAGTAQVETATVVAAGGATSIGNLTVTLTASGLHGSPITLLIPLSNFIDTTANLIALRIRQAILETTQISTIYTVDVIGDTVRLTRNERVANDPSLNLAIAAGLGVTAAANSANTTAGVADILATTGSAGDILFNATHLFIANADVLPTSTAGWERAAIAAF